MGSFFIHRIIVNRSVYLLRESRLIQVDQVILKAFFLISITIFFLSCGHTEHLKEKLEKENPDCFVMEDLSMECPNPFVTNSDAAAFGIDVKNIKVKPYETIKDIKVK